MTHTSYFVNGWSQVTRHELLFCEWMKSSDKTRAAILWMDEVKWQETSCYFATNLSVFWHLPKLELLHFYKIFAVTFWQSPSGLLIFNLVFVNSVDIRKASWMLDKEEFPRKMFKNQYITAIAIRRLQMQSGYFWILIKICVLTAEPACFVSVGQGCKGVLAGRDYRIS